MSDYTTTVPVRHYPTPEQVVILRAHGQEYIDTVNVLVQALDSDVLPEDASTKDFTAALPSAVKNQVLRDARSVWKRSFTLGIIPVLRRPICQWNNQNWRIEGETLVIPVYQTGQVGQITVRCSAVEPRGKPGIASHPAQTRQVGGRRRLHPHLAGAHYRSGHHGGRPGREDARRRARHQ